MTDDPLNTAIERYVLYRLRGMSDEDAAREAGYASHAPGEAWELYAVAMDLVDDMDREWVEEHARIQLLRHEHAQRMLRASKILDRVDNE